MVAPITHVALASSLGKHKKGKKHGAPTPSPSLLGLPAPPTGTLGPSEDASSFRLASSANDEVCVYLYCVLSVEDGCCPFKIVFDEDFYVHFMCILLCFKCVLGSA